MTVTATAIELLPQWPRDLNVLFSCLKIIWRPVLLGLLLQFVLGLLILRTRPGYLVFNWIGDRISIFVTMSDAGAKFLFGDPHYLQHFVAFKVRLFRAILHCYFDCFIVNVIQNSLTHTPGGGGCFANFGTGMCRPYGWVFSPENLVTCVRVYPNPLKQ